MTAERLSDSARGALLELARRALEAHFRGEPAPRLPSDRAEAFGQPRALFVTLRKQGDLRGCIGTLAPDGDLARTVPRYALRAALDDPRFAPLAAEELGVCRIEISVLTPPVRVADVEEIEPGRHGLILEAHGRTGLLLPQVATEWGFGRQEFLCEVAKKAGLPPEAWRSPDATLWKFEAEVFGEDEYLKSEAGTSW